MGAHMGLVKGQAASHNKTLAKSANPPINQLKLNEQYGHLPLYFEANEGQTDPQVRFVSRGRGYSMFITPREAVISL